MRITHLGHASLYVETSSVRLLIDPVLIDPHQEGFLEVFPPRTVHWEQRPEFEILFISHRHLDHFDIATLARLPREVQLIVPDDPLIAQAIEALGFTAVQRVHDLFGFTIDESSFLITPSEAGIAEHGILISDRDGTFWNQVDTVLTQAHIDLVLAQSSPVDLLFAPWQPMLEQAWQYNEPLGFPSAEYARLLQNVQRVRPRALVPGSNGFRYVGNKSWLNQVVFPQSRERFMADAVTMLPELKDRVFEADPGDVIELRQGETTRLRRASSFVTSGERDPAEIEFSPAIAQRPLRDRTGADAGEEHRSAVAEFIKTLFPAFILKHPVLFHSHREWNVIYQFEVAYARDSEHWWYDFREPELGFRSGRNPLANLFCGITAANLSGLIKGTCGWDLAAFSGDFYQHHRVYGIWENGLVFPYGVNLTNPLFTVFSGDSVFEALVGMQLEAAQAAQKSRDGKMA